MIMLSCYHVKLLRLPIKMGSTPLLYSLGITELYSRTMTIYSSNTAPTTYLYTVNNSLSLRICHAINLPKLMES